ncbi:MAG: hypothetical protein ACK417_04505 [Bacteroidia bacterium]
MIKLRVSTRVSSEFNDVKRRFNRALLEKLNPPFPPARIVLYEGELPGDRVWIELNFIFFRQVWKSIITTNEVFESSWMFKDEGVQLPFFLKSWSHTHRIEAHQQGGCVISDELAFESAWWLPNFLARALMIALMYYRKPLYKRFLGQ